MAADTEIGTMNEEQDVERGGKTGLKKGWG